MSAPHKYTLKWPEGASFQMDEKSINEIRNSLEMQFKQIIYSQPGFRFFQSIGNTNFFQAFKTDDGIDFDGFFMTAFRDANNNGDFDATVSLTADAADVVITLGGEEEITDLHWITP